MEIENIIKEVVKIIKHHLIDDYKVLLFGSWAKNNAMEMSDIDIAILGNKKTPWDIMAKILNDKEKIRKKCFKIRENFIMKEIFNSYKNSVGSMWPFIRIFRNFQKIKKCS